MSGFAPPSIVGQRGLADRLRVALPAALLLLSCFGESAREPGPPVEPEPATTATTSTTATALAAGSAQEAAPPPGPERRFTAVTITRALEADLAREIGSADAAALAQVVKRVLVWWLDPRRDLRKGDRLDVVWTPMQDEEPVAHAVWLHSDKAGDRVAVRLRPGDGPDPFPRWVDPVAGTEVALRLEGGPIERYEQITSLVNDGRHHRGVDFKAPEGTPVLAPFSGRVTRVNWHTRANGRCVEIAFDGGRYTGLFLHLSRVSVRRGARVRAGQPIGEVGNTGRSFAPHLHYQLESKRGVVDPFRVHDTRRARIPEAALARARAFLHELAVFRTAGSTQ